MDKLLEIIAEITKRTGSKTKLKYQLHFYMVTSISQFFELQQVNLPGLQILHKIKIRKTIITTSQGCQNIKHAGLYKTLYLAFYKFKIRFDNK